MHSTAPDTAPKPFLLAPRTKAAPPAARLVVVPRRPYPHRPHPHRHIRMVDKALIVLGAILLVAPAIAYLHMPSPPPQRVYPPSMARLVILPTF